MRSNFTFLEKDFPVLANFGQMAEKYCFSDPNSCLMKLGMLGETIVNLMFTYDRIPLPEENNAVRRIDTLYREGLLTQDLTDILHGLRKVRNKAVHENYASESDAKAFLQMAYSLCEWFMQTYGDWSYQHQDFVMPEFSESPAPIDPAAEEKRELLLTEQAETAASQAQTISKESRRQRASQMASQRLRSEAETRFLIDHQLRQVGWEADTQNLRYSQGTRPINGRNIAIAEWPTDSTVGNRGRVDYALFIGLQMVGVIEAKAEHKDIPSVIDYQGKEYPRNIRDEDAPYQIGTWGDYKVPFAFATNGRPYLEQYKTKSGIWFLDLRQPSNVPKALHGWMSPDNLRELLAKDPAAGNQALEQMPFDLLRDKDGLNLRDYQLRAIQAAEQAIIEGKNPALLAMATGTGKTRTVLGMIYRFLKTGRFKRVLFLVDRTALGEQALDVFREVKLEDLMPLADIYNIKGLEDKEIERETRIHVATVQGMVRRILYNDGETMPAVNDYDLIIVDEAHRGYLLDKEMGDTELLYRDQRDYQSKYRSVIEYFDAVKIALTATPALQTTEIFGQPVFKYTYREAVIEGYLVDHDAPHNLHTRLRDEGIHYRSGDTITIYDPLTGEITNSELLDDELDFDVEQFNKRVITRPFNEAVLAEIAQYIDPENPEEQGKTLIYAVDDQHADMIVDILKNIYSEYGVDNDAIKKITGSVGGGNPKKVQEAIKRFKNERYPSIAVTVDLLTTGIDVPEITNLVFLRRVKSRILFEQMLGRATRLCPKIHKTHFEIYDPVGVYESLEAVNTMKPVVTNPSATFDQLLDGLEVIDDEKQIGYVEDHTDDFYNLSTELAEFERKEAFTGCELVHDTHRLALMNAMLHGIEGQILLGDTLSNLGKQMHDLDLVLTNPPFGTKKGGERATRDDFTFPTSNKQLNFLQHIYRSLKTNGKARAAVVLPDNVLFADGDGEKIRCDLMDKCNLHTILRLPTGIFYAQGVKTNVLFFTRGKTDKDNTKEVWFYDLRTNMPSFGKTTPLKPEHFTEFESAYEAEDRHAVQDERWSVFTREQIAEKGNSLDLGLIRDDSVLDYNDLPDPAESAEEAAANLEEAVDLLRSVITELRALEVQD